MAYLAFQDLGGMAAIRSDYRVTPVPNAVPPAGHHLTALEWSVVAIARKDARSTLRQPGRISTAIRILFNLRNPRLADERLEALRRMAVLSWQDGYSIAPREVRAFLAAGFTTSQYETIVDHISTARIIPPRTVMAA